LVVTCIAASRGAIPLNHYFGVRLPVLMRSNAAWRAGHAAGGGSRGDRVRGRSDVQLPPVGRCDRSGLPVIISRARATRPGTVAAGATDPGRVRRHDLPSVRRHLSRLAFRVRGSRAGIPGSRVEPAAGAGARVGSPGALISMIGPLCKRVAAVIFQSGKNPPPAGAGEPGRRGNPHSAASLVPCGGSAVMPPAIGAGGDLRGGT